MVGVDLVDGSVAMPGTSDDMFLVLVSFIKGVYLAKIAIDAFYKLTITHTASVGRGDVRIGYVRNESVQTGNHVCFEVLWHVV